MLNSIHVSICKDGFFHLLFPNLPYLHFHNPPPSDSGENNPQASTWTNTSSHHRKPIGSWTQHPHKSLAKLSKSYGPIMSLKLGQVTAVVVSSPETIQEVLQTYDDVLSYRAVPDALTPYDHCQQGFPLIPISPTCKNIRRTRNTYLLSPKTLDTNRNLRRMRIDDLLDNVRRRAVNGGAVDIGGVVFAIWSVDIV
ncbi:unnamed protein product [Citrullus colocynthis]|uniref:Uncharacterized protein n=1 Tax=Citrullus colocynthis TaxID=252529 RepID=A0ABP0XS82_9ROSI